MSMSASEAEVALTNTAHLYARVSERSGYSGSSLKYSGSPRAR